VKVYNFCEVGDSKFITHIKISTLISQIFEFNMKIKKYEDL